MGESPLMRVSPKFKKYADKLAKELGYNSPMATEEILKTLKKQKKKKKRKYDDWGIISVK